MGRFTNSDFSTQGSSVFSKQGRSSCSGRTSAGPANMAATAHEEVISFIVWNIHFV